MNGDWISYAPGVWQFCETEYLGKVHDRLHDKVTDSVGVDSVTCDGQSIERLSLDSILDGNVGFVFTDRLIVRLPNGSSPRYHKMEVA